MESYSYSRCIEKWFENFPGKKRNVVGTCPSCKKPAVKKDIRPLFLPNLTAIDSSETEKLKKQLADAEFKRLQIEKQYADLKINYEYEKSSKFPFFQKITELENENRALKEVLGRLE